MELPFKCILTRSIFIISSSCWTLRYVSLLNKRLNVSEVNLTARLDDPNGFQAKKSVFVLQSCRVHTAGEKMEEHAVIVTEGRSRLWRLWTVLLTPRDRFDHWTSATVRHSTPNCRVTTRPTIYQSRFFPLEDATFICSEMRRGGTTPALYSAVSPSVETISALID